MTAGEHARRQSRAAFEFLGAVIDGAPPEHVEVFVGEAEKDCLDLEALRRLADRLHAHVDGQARRAARLSSAVSAFIELADCGCADAVIQTLTRHARALFDADFAFTTLIGECEDGETIESVVCVEGPTTALSTDLRLRVRSGYGLPTVARSPGVATATSDFFADDRFSRSAAVEVLRVEEVRGLLAVPLQYAGDTLGHTYVANRTVRHFSADDCSLMTHLGRSAGAALGPQRQRDDIAAELERAGAEVQRLRQHRDDLLEDAELDLDLLDAGLGDAALAVFLRRLGIRLPASLQLVSLGETVLGAHDWDEAGPREGEIETEAPVFVSGYQLGVLRMRAPSTLCPRVRSRLATWARVAGLIARVDLARSPQAVAAERWALLSNLLDGRDLGPLAEQMLREAGVGADEPFTLLLLEPAPGSLDRAVHWATERVRDRGGLCTARGDVVVLLTRCAVPSTVAEQAWADADRVLAGPVTVVASRPTVDVGTVGQVYNEAARFLQAVRALGGTGRVVSVDGMGFLGVLLSDDRDFGALVQEVLGPVAANDREFGTDLLRTLDVFLEHGQSPTHAAKVLHAHVNTVARRLKRLDVLLGPDWRRGDRLLDIQLALKLWRLGRSFES